MAADIPDMEAERTRRRLRAAIAFLGVLAAVLVATTAWLVIQRAVPGRGAQAPVVSIGGPFELTTHEGARLSDRDLAGAPYAVFFGFTHCPEVCPTTLWEMSQALGELGEEGSRLRVLFVTVDPERDTPSALATYLQSFDPRIVGLTGSEAEIAAMATAYRAYWRRVPTEGGDYTMDHTASVYLMDSQGRFVGTIAYEEEARTRLAKLVLLLS